MRDEFLAAHGLTGFGAAKLQHPAIDRRAAEIVIEADHAKGFGARDVQRIGDQRDGAIVDVAELLLQIVQNWQRRPAHVALTIDQRSRQIQIKGRSARHDILPGRLTKCASAGLRFKLNVWNVR